MLGVVVLTISHDERLDLIQRTSTSLLTATPPCLHPVRKHQSIKGGCPGLIVSVESKETRYKSPLPEQGIGQGDAAVVTLEGAFD
jgi:hypothetical protein